MQQNTTKQMQQDVFSTNHLFYFERQRLDTLRQILNHARSVFCSVDCTCSLILCH